MGLCLILGIYMRKPAPRGFGRHALLAAHSASTCSGTWDPIDEGGTLRSLLIIENLGEHLTLYPRDGSEHWQKKTAVFLATHAQLLSKAF